VIFIIALPFVLYSTEVERRESFAAFAEAEEVAVHLPGDGPPMIPPPGPEDQGKLLFFHSNDVKTDGPLTHPDFGFSVENAMRLKWTPQYCQWQEIEQCKQSCTGSGDDEQCTTTCHFDYVKGWVNHRVNSLLFDQAAMHHNPQRDPFPAHVITHDRAQAGAFSITQPVLETLKEFRHLYWSYNGRVKPESEYGFFERHFRAVRHYITGWNDDSRFDNLANLRPMSDSYATREHKFEHIGNGYMYSRYERSQAEQMFQWMGEYMEGSLFDWQMGDLLDRAFDACRPGDIRGWFDVADPTEATILAGVADGQGTLGAFRTSRDYLLSRMYVGEVSLEYMRDDNKWEFVKIMMGQRFLALVWAGLVCFGLQTALGRDVCNPMCIIGTAGLLIAAKWAAVYGISDFTGHSTSISTIVVSLVSFALVAAGAGGAGNGKQKTM